MSIKKQFILSVTLILFAKTLDAQFWVPFITIDPDGYTNIREQPNAKSKIVGKVYKYQIFYFIGEECDDDLSNYSSDSWLFINTDQVSGYIYKKKIFTLWNLPALKRKKSIQQDDNEGSIIVANDTLTVCMQIQPFDKNIHKLKIKNDEDGEHVWSIDEEDFYGTDYRMPFREIKSIEVSYNGRIKTLQQSKLKKFYNPSSMRVYLGHYGELYIAIGGGADAGSYGVWMSIVDGDILYECYQDNCW
jgi:hypothetical protein